MWYSIRAHTVAFALTPDLIFLHRPPARVVLGKQVLWVLPALREVHAPRGSAHGYSGKTLPDIISTEIHCLVSLVEDAFPRDWSDLLIILRNSSLALNCGKIPNCQTQSIKESKQPKILVVNLRGGCIILPRSFSACWDLLPLIFSDESEMFNVKSKQPKLSAGNSVWKTNQTRRCFYFETADYSRDDHVWYRLSAVAVRAPATCTNSRRAGRTRNTGH